MRQATTLNRVCVKDYLAVSKLAVRVANLVNGQLVKHRCWLVCTRPKAEAIDESTAEVIKEMD